MKIIVLGSPGVGKGTYTKELLKEMDLIHVSSGDLFRDNIKGSTELGKKAKEYIDAGKLVPDEVTIAMVKDRIEKEDCEQGYILDGFPRTIPQAEALSKITDIDLVINFIADKETILQRLGGRRICKGCGSIFHMLNLPPKSEGVCDNCSGELYQRDDDKEEAIGKRLEEYEEKTAPLIGFYSEKGLLKEVKVNEDFGTHGDVIMGKIKEAIKSVKNN